LNIFRNFAEFVALHYALSIRNDTKYWQANNRRVYSPGLESLAPQSFQGFNDLQHIKMFTSRAPTHAGITRIAVGMNYPLLDATTARQHEIRDQSDYKEVFNKSFESFEKKKMYWNSLADLEPSLYEYLKNTIYKD
jgi:hypothetical protein